MRILDAFSPGRERRQIASCLPFFFIFRFGTGSSLSVFTRTCNLQTVEPHLLFLRISIMFFLQWIFAFFSTAPFCLFLMMCSNGLCRFRPSLFARTPSFFLFPSSAFSGRFFSSDDFVFFSSPYFPFLVDRWISSFRPLMSGHLFFLRLIVRASRVCPLILCVLFASLCDMTGGLPDPHRGVSVFFSPRQSTPSGCLHLFLPDQLLRVTSQIGPPSSTLIVLPILFATFLFRRIWPR